MCLGIPGRVVETYREHDVLMGKVSFGGVARRVCLEHVPDVGPDDYVLVHVGFALSRIDEEEARGVFELLEAMGQLDELGDAKASDVDVPRGGDASRVAAPCDVDDGYAPRDQSGMPRDEIPRRIP